MVEKAISQFGKLIVWEEDHDHLGTVLVKARVSSLDAIPWFFNFTEGSDPESDCWTAQCEILLTRLLGAQPQDEDFPPLDPDDVDPNAFHFFGFGQPGQGPPNPPPPNQPNVQAVGWAPWPQQDNVQMLGAQMVNDILGQQDEAPPLIPLQQDPIDDIVLNPGDGHQFHAEDAVGQEPQVLDMGDLTDANTDSDVDVRPVNLPIPQVEIFPFPDFNNLQ